MILITDSGSTKTSWFYSKGANHSVRFSTNGINPFFRTSEDIVEELQKKLVPEIDSPIKEIHFYGAGIINREKEEVILHAMKELFPSSKIEVQSDLVAAARAAFGKESGIACILGTGSNSCLYDGHKIVENVPPLGFILGDEGSGAVLGRKVLGDYLKGKMPKNISRKFQAEFPFSYAEFLEHVYKKEKPNKFLAQFVPFLSKNIQEEYCSCLIENAFNEFVDRNIRQYKDYMELEIGFVGSVAYHFQEQLKLVLNNNKLKFGRILKEPMDALIQFHIEK